jgi:ABC-type dipeptide/oligopeptide/nickel transport system permease component
MDLPMIPGTVLFTAVQVTISDLGVDIACTCLGPRVKYC